MICDYSSTFSPYIPDSWGSGSAGGYYNSYDVKDGRAGIFGMGANGECFMWYTGVGMDGIDLSNASIQFQFATWSNSETEYVLLAQVYIQ